MTNKQQRNLLTIFQTYFTLFNQLNKQCVQIIDKQWQSAELYNKTMHMYKDSKTRNKPINESTARAIRTVCQLINNKMHVYNGSVRVGRVGKSHVVMCYK